MYLCMYVCMYVCMYAHTYRHTYKHTYITLTAPVLNLSAAGHRVTDARCLMMSINIPKQLHTCMHVCMYAYTYILYLDSARSESECCWTSRDRCSLLDDVYQHAKAVALRLEGLTPRGRDNRIGALVYVCVCVYACVYAYVYLCVYVCVYVCRRFHTCMHT